MFKFSTHRAISVKQDTRVILYLTYPALNETNKYYLALYDKFRTTIKHCIYKLLILYKNIRRHNGYNIQCRQKNKNLIYIKTKFKHGVKVNLTPPLTPTTTSLWTRSSYSSAKSLEEWLEMR